ncbi:ribosomal protein S9, Ribosomal protein S5 domain 2-type fold protein [Artemisia annua]|uniref:Ribosomal protein S9, Ribosomal protein S5 domain 2-type fold protein n=1 Tax=Artemisia annua TaxID=35608 RepID=A0A2U1NTZ1_ARTAN|nr:ribosomal protein S9, Ribosomal protein S5 domain 2-type fold protein [Artemisia annua]
MLSRILASKPSSSKCSCFIKTLLSSSSQSQNQNPNNSSSIFSTINKGGHRYFSSGNNDNNDNNKSSSSWNISSLGGGESIESLFSFSTVQEEESSKVSKNPNNDDNDNGVFALSGQEDNEKKQQEEEEKNRLLDEEAKSLTGVLKERLVMQSIIGPSRLSYPLLFGAAAGVMHTGEVDLVCPDHAFGDLIAASGITDDMLDSLMALKDLDDVPGLPPLSTIEDMRYEKNTRKSTRADIERQKQEEIANARVRQVDSQGRAYGTGKRKCSIARVWIEPGEGKFLINDNQFDIYFPMLDQRAALLRPLTETKTLGLLDVNCTVKGGGVSGAIRLGMSRALQNWAPDQFRPPLKEAGFLTRDSRIVERKKPGVIGTVGSIVRQLQQDTQQKTGTNIHVGDASVESDE